jgi:hypothetical protein
VGGDCPKKTAASNPCLRDDGRYLGRYLGGIIMGGRYLVRHDIAWVTMSATHLPVSRYPLTEGVLASSTTLWVADTDLTLATDYLRCLGTAQCFSAGWLTYLSESAARLLTNQQRRLVSCSPMRQKSHNRFLQCKARQGKAQWCHMLTSSGDAVYLSHSATLPGWASNALYGTPPLGPRWFVKAN